MPKSLKETLTDIADALREGADAEGLTMRLDEMPYWAKECRRWGELKGHEKGYNEGFQDGKQVGYNKGFAEGKAMNYDVGYAEGKQSEYDALWDSIQVNGTRNNYSNGFANGWTKETFKPKYSVITSSGTTVANGVFYNFNDNLSTSEMETKAIDLVEVAEQQGIVFDFSKAKQLSQTFATGGIKRIGVVDASNKTSLYQAFNQHVPYSLTRIEKIISSATTTWGDNMVFKDCQRLSHCIFEGVIGVTGLIISDATKLDKESLTSIINALSTTTSGLSVTLSKTAVNKAFETSSGKKDGSTSEEWTTLTATKTNWTISLA